LRSRILLLSALLLFSGSCVRAADLPKPKATPGHVMLPQEHQYQRVLRKYMATLSEKDFDHGVKEPLTVAAPSDDPDELCRTWTLTLYLPKIGTKRAAPSVSLPPEQFTLAAIEGKGAVLKPWIWPNPLTWLANWNYAGNPYHKSRALKLRAFVTAAVDLMMLDDLQQRTTGGIANRSDWICYHLIIYGYTYAGVKDVIAPEARKAFEAGMKRIVRRVVKWGPRGDETHYDIATAAALALVAKAIDDKEVSRLAEAHAKKLFANEWYYNPAGYFPDQGCLDCGFNGLSLFFATWMAAVTDWPFVDEAVAKAYKLRAHMYLPDPDGNFYGPSHMNARTSNGVVHEQWDFATKFCLAAQMTDEAASTTRVPTRAKMIEEIKKFVHAANGAIKQLPRVRERGKLRHLRIEELRSRPWTCRLITNNYNFPVGVNLAFDHYVDGYFARRAALRKAKSPLLKYPFQRAGTFVEAFEKVLLAAKMPSFGVIVHTGPVSEFQGAGHAKYSGPYGLGGGALSAFWTPTTGSVILGRRGGMTLHGRSQTRYDQVAQWRLWPTHAVSGATLDGKFFTSARIQRPDAVYDVAKDRADVQVSGMIPAAPLEGGKALAGKVSYRRTFHVDAKAMRVETTVAGDGADKVAELYEVIPVFLRDLKAQRKTSPTTIEFRSGDKWIPATRKYEEKVTAVRLKRFSGAVRITFDRPRRAKLSDADWVDKYLSRAACRNILIDLLESGDRPAVLKDAKKVAYRIEPVAR